MRYLVAIEAGGADQAYGVVVPDLPGCFSGGDTLEEALNNAEQAIAQHIELALSEGLEVPKRKDASEHMSNQDFAGFQWGWVKPNIFTDKAKKVNVTLPQNILSGVDGFLAHTDEWNRSSFLAEAAAEKLLRLQAGG